MSSRGATSATARCWSKSPVECGLDRNQVEKFIADGADTDLVRQEIEQAQAIGVSGVPFFIFGGRVGVPGAQEPSALRKAIAQARAAVAEGGVNCLNLSRLVEPSDKFGRQFDARRMIVACIRGQCVERQRRRGRRRP